MTGTYAGQFVMAGFLNLRVKKWVRVLITRTVAIVPTVLVALLFDQSDNQLDLLNEWLNVLQSIQLPFAVIPLLHMIIRRDVVGEFIIGSKTLVGKGFLKSHSKFLPHPLSLFCLSVLYSYLFFPAVCINFSGSSGGWDQFLPLVSRYHCFTSSIQDHFVNSSFNGCYLWNFYHLLVCWPN